MEVLTRYARSGDRQITYQVAGERPLDVVVVPRFFSNIEMDWELPPSARFLGQLASFAQLIQFDRRGAGMSGGIAGATPLEEQVDDARAVIVAAASEQPVLISIAEGCALAVLFAASYPNLVRAPVLITPTPRVVPGPGYEWAQKCRGARCDRSGSRRALGSDSSEQPWAAFAGQDEQRRRLLARHRRLSITPDAAAASLAMVGELDVRYALPSVQCPTLLLRCANDVFIDERHSRYAAAHIPNAQYVEIPAAGQTAHEIEQFVTGVRRPVVSDRTLATVLFTEVLRLSSLPRARSVSAWSPATLLSHSAETRPDLYFKAERSKVSRLMKWSLSVLSDLPSAALIWFTFRSCSGVRTVG
jgi:pimeloyl-ACP methyl ester carboxylesterase